jgi:uncharacterized protein DUF4154
VILNPSSPPRLTRDVADPLEGTCDGLQKWCPARVSSGEIMRFRHRRILLRVMAGMACAVWLMFSVLSVPVMAQEVVSREYEIKAGVISLLGKFVTWPGAMAPNRERPLTIGVLGQDPFFEGGINQLDRIVAAERAKGRPIAVRRFDSAKDYQPCHILFVSEAASEKSLERSLVDRLTAVKKLTDGKPVLLIGQSPGLARQGATANLLFDRTTNLIRLEINPDAANRAGLKLAPDLLRLKLVDIIRDKNP